MPSLIINGAIAVLTVGSWLMMALSEGDTRRLATRGLGSLKYFTVQSNLLSGCVSLVYLVRRLAVRTSAPAWLLAAKLVATAAVMLTFWTVILLLGPKFGWRKMYVGGNFWMHLVLPLLAAWDCLLYAPVGTLPFAVTFLAMVPCVLYGLWYLGMIVRHGPVEGDKVYDFYGFLRWGSGKAPLVFVVMQGASWAMGLGLWLGSRAMGLA